MILSELNRQPLPFEKVVATWGILFARAMAGQRRQLVNTDTVEASNALFQKIFPPRLPEMMDMAVNDPQGYRDKISHFETSAPALPMIEFETRGSYDLLIADDPCEILQVDTWPGFYPGEEIFTGIRFKKSVR